jgi:hypothetical protein
MSDNPDHGVWSSEELPPSWAWAAFDDFWRDFTSSQKKLPQQSYKPDGPFPVIDQGQRQIGGYSDAESLVSDAEPPAIVFGDHTRVCKFIETPFIQGADGVRVLKPKAVVEAKYAYYALNALQLPDKGYSRHFKFLKSSQFPLAPEPEQRRIVAKLDSLRARSARARHELDRIPKLIERYKQTILAKAFSGELTADWREQNDSCQDWPIVPVSTIADVVTGSTPPTAEKTRYFGGSIPFFKPTDLDAGYRVQIPRETLTEEGANRARRVPAGSTLVTCIGATIAKTGLARVDCCTNQQINALVPDLARVQPEWLYWMVISPEFRDSIIANASATTLPIINKGRFEQLELPLPDKTEQVEIASRVEQAFTWLDKIATEHARAEHLLPKLDQAILAKAFRGELVPQDPTDEPASVLLERIKAGRVGLEQSRRRRVKSA